ncbi:post-transcriptional regulator [Sinobaca sp. H24]|uniref:post-transcriptional regulator n=1 Tax=Sinobaca sp. H24 TaxID=2923376 RepID=UPI0020796752|nr:post-transcriptional regulator [Sinobaca sp. H24]
MLYSVSNWKDVVQPALQSKKEEFHMLGYINVTEETIWEYLLENERTWKKRVHLHKVVQDILHLKMSDYMNRLTINSYIDLEAKSRSGNQLASILEDIESTRNARSEG